MKTLYFRIAALAAFCAITTGAGQVSAEPNRVTFPTNLERLVHYTTVTRGNVRENMLTSQEAIDAIKLGRLVPNGTQFVLVDYRDDKLFRYFVMEKREGWGVDYDAARRTDDWQFQNFTADKKVNLSENTARCQSCHKGREENQYLYTFNDIKRAK